MLERIYKLPERKRIQLIWGIVLVVFVLLLSAWFFADRIPVRQKGDLGLSSAFHNQFTKFKEEFKNRKHPSSEENKSN
jgi:hypothetical protein